MPAGCLGEETIVGLFQGRVSSEKMAEIDAHIDVCGECRALLSSLAQRDESEEAGPISATVLASKMQGLWLEDLPRTCLVDPRSSALVGTTLAERFMLERVVGSGGMADVFRARDERSGEPVAVKMTRGSGSADTARFEREARLLVHLQHPAIVRHVAHGRSLDGTPFLAMEWLEGEDLSSRLRRGVPSIEETVRIGARVASALGAAHRAGVVHRDIKPSNIFLKGGDAEQALVIDFGVARGPWQEGTTLATRTGTLLGTLGYMAPEQALGAKTADARADVFSLGCVLFECLVGRRLFAGAHAVEVLAKLLTEPIPRSRTLRSAIPPTLDRLVTRLLLRDVTTRPSDCGAIAEELLAILAGMRGDEGTNPPVTAESVRPRPGKRSSRWFITAALLLGVGVPVGARALRAGHTVQPTAGPSMAIPEEVARVPEAVADTPTSTASEETLPVPAASSSTAATAKSPPPAAKPPRPRLPSSSPPPAPFGTFRN